MCNQNQNDKGCFDEFYFEREEFERLMNDFDKDAQNYEVFDQEVFNQSFNCLSDQNVSI